VTKGPLPKGSGLEPAVPATTGQLTIPPPPTPPASPAPEKRSWWVWAGAGAVAVLAIALLVFQPWAAKGLPVTVETVTPGPLTRVLAVNGRIAPLHLVEVRPRVGGAVISVRVEEGAVVRQGDILAQIDASGQQAVLRQALAGLDAGLVAQAQAEADLARATALGQNITRAALQVAQSAKRTADQEVARLTAAFDQARIELDKYTLTAPITGTAIARDAEVGQVADTATALFSLADLGQLVVETDVDEAYASQIMPGLAAVLQLKGETAKRDGRVDFVASQVDAATGGLVVKLAFDKPVSAAVGLTVTANIVVETKDAAITVPRSAIVRDESGAAVYAVAADLAVRRPVTVVDWPAERVEVTEGLTAGDLIITDATGISGGIAVVLPEP
jgi:RND family efflux transporter MFP subunit